MTRRFALLTSLIGATLAALAFVCSAYAPPPEQVELLWNDLPWYFTPTFAVLHRALAEGYFPLWNPWQLAGWPFLAAFQTQVLYPPAWAVAWLSPTLAVSAHAALHLVFAFVGMALLSIGLGMGWAGALASAGVYTLSRPVAGVFYAHSAGIAVCAWLPWCAAAALALGRSSTATWPLVRFAICIALALLAGGPEHFLYMAAVVGLLAVADSARSGFRSMATTSLRLGGGFALAAFFCAAQILPTLELMAYAVRSSDSFTADYAGRFPVTAQGLFNAVVFGANGVGRVSIVVAPLALVGLLVAATRARTAFAVFFALVLLDFLRGNSGWIFPVYYEWVPFARAFRTHLRAEFVWAVFAALAAGFGMHALSLHALSLHALSLHALSLRALSLRALSLRALALRIRTVRALPVRKQPRPLMGTALVCTILAVMSVDLVRANFIGKAFIPITNEFDINGNADLTQVLKAASGPDRVFVDFGAPGAGLHHKVGMLRGFRDVAEYDALVPAQYPAFFAVPEGTPWMGRLQVGDRTKKVGLKTIKIPGVQLSALDLTSTRFYLAPTGSRHNWLSKVVGKTVATQGGYQLIERASARPRVFLVHHLVGVDEPKQALWWLRQPNFDASKVATVLAPAPALAEPVAGQLESARIVAESPNSVSIEAVCSSRCMMVLTDLDFPGWEASVDGAATPILAANYLFRGLVLEPGAHRIEFDYRPKPLRAGIAISLSTMLLALVAVLRARNRQRRNP